MELRRFFDLIRREIAAHSCPLEMWRGLRRQFANLALACLMMAVRDPQHQR
jgi:hypothetical protein